MLIFKFFFPGLFLGAHLAPIFPSLFSDSRHALLLPFRSSLYSCRPSGALAAHVNLRGGSLAQTSNVPHLEFRKTKPEEMGVRAGREWGSRRRESRSLGG